MTRPTVLREDNTLRRILLVLIIGISFSAAAGDSIFRLLPAGTQLLLVADIDRLCSSALFDKIEKSELYPPLNRLVRKIQVLSGVDLRKDIDQLIISASSDDYHHLSGIITGRFNTDSLEVFFRSYPGARSNTYRQHTVYILKSHKHTIYITFAKSGMLLFSFDWLHLCRSLDVISGNAKNATGSELAGWAQVPYNGGLYVAINNAGEFLRRSQTMRATRRITFSMPQPAVNLNAKLRISTATEDDARQLFELSRILAHLAIRKYAAATQGQTNNKESTKALGEILKRIDVALDEKHLTVGLDCPVKSVLGFLRQQNLSASHKLSAQGAGR